VRREIESGSAGNGRDATSIRIGLPVSCPEPPWDADERPKSPDTAHGEGAIPWATAPRTHRWSGRTTPPPTPAFRRRV